MIALYLIPLIEDGKLHPKEFLQLKVVLAPGTCERVSPQTPTPFFYNQISQTSPRILFRLDEDIFPPGLAGRPLLGSGEKVELALSPATRGDCF